MKKYLVLLAVSVVVLAGSFAPALAKSERGEERSEKKSFITQEFDGKTRSETDWSRRKDNDHQQGEQIREREDEDDNRGGKKDASCVSGPFGHLVAPGWLKKNGSNSSEECIRSLPHGIWKKLPWWRWWFGVPRPPFSTSTDVTPPVISSNTVTGIGTSSALVSWVTDEFARAKVYYAPTTSFPLANASSVVRTSFLTNHALTLSGLTPSSTYFYVIESKDIWGNTATTSYQGFATLAGADVTPPLITAVSVSSTTSSSVAVSWTTNESATSKVYYSTSTPLMFGTAQSASSSVYVTSHALTLAPLTASTTYYYVVESKDSSGNTAISTEASFVTL